MAIKNYLIGAHRRIKSTQWAWGDRAREGDLYEIYGRMYDISRASFRHFMEEDYEELRWEEEIDSIQFAMKLNWNNCYNLWHDKAPCNILAAGPDVMMVKPTKVFGEYDKFTMFNWTDPKRYDEPNPWDIRIANYFNGDFKYYPSTMSPEVWKLGKDMTQIWEEQNTPESWNNEQVIENAMFWSQGDTFEQAHKPHLFYQAFMINDNPDSLHYANQWNMCDFNDAHVLHFAGTRGARARMEWMEQIAEALGIPI